MRTRQRLSRLPATLLALLSFQILPAQAQTVEELQRQLEAQQQINAQLRQRVLTLEETIEQMQAAEGTESGSGGSPGDTPQPQFAGFAPPR